MVLTLLKHGAAWRKGDSQWQKTAMHMAAMKGRSHLVKILLQLDKNQVSVTIDRGGIVICIWVKQVLDRVHENF